MTDKKNESKVITGKIGTRGAIKKGLVISDRANKTAIVEIHRLIYIPKYKRYARVHSKIAVHNPEEINAKIGDLVQIAECRRVSKTKAWLVTEIIGKGKVKSKRR